MAAAAAANRPAFNSAGGHRWGVTVGAGGDGGGGRGGGRKRSAAVAMAGAGPADDMGVQRGGSGGSRSFHLAYPPSSPAL